MIFDCCAKQLFHTCIQYNRCYTHDKKLKKQGFDSDIPDSHTDLIRLGTDGRDAAVGVTGAGAVTIGYLQVTELTQLRKPKRIM